MVNTRKKTIISIMPLLITFLALLLIPRHTMTAYASDTKLSLSTTSFTIGNNYNKNAIIKGSIYGDVSSQYYVYGIDENYLVTIQSGYTMSGSSFSLNITGKKAGTTKVKVAIKDQRANQVVATGYVNVTVKNFDVSKMYVVKDYDTITGTVGGTYTVTEHLYTPNGLPLNVYWTGGIDNTIKCEFSNFTRDGSYANTKCKYTFLKPGTYNVKYGIQDADRQWIKSTTRQFTVKSAVKNQSLTKTVGDTFKFTPSASTTLQNKFTLTSFDSTGLSNQGNNTFKAVKAGTYKVVYTLSLYYNNKWYTSENLTYTITVKAPQTTTKTTATKTTTKTTTTTTKATTKSTTATTTKTTARSTVTTTKTTARSTFASSVSSVSTSVTTTAAGYPEVRDNIFVVLAPDEEIRFPEFEGEEFTFESWDTDIADVGKDGTITAYEEGEADIYVYCDDEFVSFIVVCVSDMYDFDNFSRMNVGETKKIIEEDYYMDYYYDTSNPSVARVSEDGVVTAVGEGEAYISICAEDDEEEVLGRMTVIVKNTQDDLYITLNPEDEILIDQFEDMNPVFTSDDPTVATVSKDGLITAVHSGEAVVTVTCGNGTKVKIYVSVNRLYYEDFTLELEMGETVQIEKYIGLNPVYESTDTSVATVSQDGFITAVGAGNAIITVSDTEEEQENHIYVTVYPSAVSTTAVISVTSTTTAATTSKPATSTTTAATSTTTAATTSKPATSTTTAATTSKPATSTTTAATTSKPVTSTTTAATTSKPATSTTTTVTTTSNTTTAVTTTSTTETQPVKQNGDINGDGTVNLKDVVLIRRFIAGGWGVELDESIADVNKDGTVNLKDVVLIRRYIAGGWDVKL